MHPIKSWIDVNDLMQSRYRYQLVESAGKNFATDFTPYFIPKEMLKLGVFEGKYMNDCRGEFPEDWFTDAKLSDIADPSLNYFEIKSRQSLQIWQSKGWVIGDDPRGWFQWYCRYYQGRRDDDVDKQQIKRWRAFTRHAAQVKANCDPGNLACRPRQRQALLQWSYNPFI